MMLRVGTLSDDALDAASRFHADVLPEVRRALASAEGHLTLVFAPAAFDHRAWRVAAVQELARQAAPVRVNAVESDDEAAIAAASGYIAEAPGLTGQLLPLDGNGVSPVLYQV